MESIKDKAAIIGMGCTRFGELWNKSGEDLMVEAAYEAFEDAGVEPGAVQAAWLGTVFSGVTATSLSVPLKLQYIPVTRVENLCATGTEAIRAATYAVIAGVCDIALAVGIEKLKDAGYGLPPPPIAENEIGDTGVSPLRMIPPPVAFGSQAVRYFHQYGLTPEEGKKLLGKIAVKNHHNGSLSPKAQYQREITLEEAVNAPIVSWPLGVLDCCGVTDGAAAAIITRADMAKNFRDDPIYIKSFGVSTSARQAAMTTAGDFTHFEENVRASRWAYDEAGIKDPFKELDIAEVHDCFTITELLIYEDLGFCPRGKAKEYIESGVFELGGELSVNTDGGLKCFGHPLGASGLRMMYEVYKQLQGKADKRQLKNPKLGLTHNLAGNIGHGPVVAIGIFGNELG
jgi:acetyl-CoA C-acetyltransferase